MSKQTGVTGVSNPVEFPTGDGAIAVSNQSSLASTVEISIGDDIWVPDKDNTAPAANGVYAVEVGFPCWIRLNVSSGSCDFQGVPQLKEKYR